MNEKLIFCNSNTDDPTVHLPVTIIDQRTGEVVSGHIAPEKLYTFLSGNANLRRVDVGTGSQAQRKTA